MCRLREDPVPEQIEGIDEFPQWGAFYVWVFPWIADPVHSKLEDPYPLSKVSQQQITRRAVSSCSPQNLQLLVFDRPTWPGAYTTAEAEWRRGRAWGESLTNSALLETEATEGNTTSEGIKVADLFLRCTRVPSLPQIFSTPFKLKYCF